MLAKNRPVAILFLTLFVVMVGFGMIIPVIPFYVESFGAGPVHLGLLMATFSLMQFICAPFWGSYSDRVGRRPVLLSGLAGYVISALIMAVATDLWMLFAARVLGGVLSSATLPTAMAYIGDSTSHQNRGAGMGILGAAMGLGVIFGPGIGGVLASFGIAAPFFFAAASAAAILVFAFFALPESLPRERRIVAKRAQAPWERLAELGGALRGPLAVYFGLALITSFGMANLESVFAYFASDRFGYGPAEMGVLFFAMGVVSVVVQGGGVGRLVNRYGEERVVMLGLFLGGLGFILMTFSFDMVSLLLFLSVNSVGAALLRPAISTLLSKRTRAGQGTTMGLQGSFDSLGRIVGPVWGGYLYGLGPNLPYYTAAVVFAIGLAMLAMAGLGPLPAGEPVVSRSDRAG